MLHGVGAGAASLAAAPEFSQSGLRITVVEARDRVGGKIYALHNSTLSPPVELGAEFVHREPKETRATVRAAVLDAIGRAWIVFSTVSLPLRSRPPRELSAVTKLRGPVAIIHSRFVQLANYLNLGL